jgi:hypothetical protein
MPSTGNHTLDLILPGVVAEIMADEKQLPVPRGADATPSAALPSSSETHK